VSLVLIPPDPPSANDDLNDQGRAPTGAALLLLA